MEEKIVSVELLVYDCENNSQNFIFDFPTVKSANSFFMSVMESLMFSPPHDFQLYLNVRDK